MKKVVAAHIHEFARTGDIFYQRDTNTPSETVEKIKVKNVDFYSPEMDNMKIVANYALFRLAK